MTMAENGQQTRAYFGEFTANEMRAGIATMSALLDRLQLGGTAGLQYRGERDTYKELGYPDQLTVDHFESRYDRDGLSGRIVDKPAMDAWRRPPIVHDGDENGPTDTDFAQSVGQLAKRLQLWKVFKDLDQETGIGEYGVLLIGVRGEADLDEEVDETLNGPEDVIYLRPYRQSAVDIVEHEEDKANPRFGKPTFYEVDLGKVGDEELGEEKVHWTRIIHVAENSIDGVYGRPRMQRSFNRLMDLDKVVGSGAEAVWRLIYKGLVVSAKEGWELDPGNTTVIEDLEDQFLKLANKLRRVVVAGGADVKELGTSETPDPSGIFGIIIDLVSADTGIPKRLLLGSERGELASSTDEATWAGEIRNRQTSFAEPSILRPFLDWCIARKALPEPENGRYTMEWPPLFERSEMELVEVGAKRIEALGIAAREAIREFGLASSAEVRGQVGLPPEIEGETADDMLDIEDEMSEEMVEGP